MLLFSGFSDFLISPRGGACAGYKHESLFRLKVYLLSTLKCHERWAQKGAF